MFKEDGTSYLSKVEIKEELKVQGQIVSSNPSINPTGLTNITATDLQSLVEEIDPLLGDGGSESQINGKYTTQTNNDQSEVMISNNLTLPSGWNEIKADVHYNLTGSSGNVTLKLVSAGLVGGSDNTQRVFSSVATGRHNVSAIFYVNNETGSSSTIRLAMQSSAGIITDSKSMFTVKALSVAPSIAYESLDSGGL